MTKHPTDEAEGLRRFLVSPPDVTTDPQLVALIEKFMADEDAAFVHTPTVLLDGELGSLSRVVIITEDLTKRMLDALIGGPTIVSRDKLLIEGEIGTLDCASGTRIAGWPILAVPCIADALTIEEPKQDRLWFQKFRPRKGRF